MQNIFVHQIWIQGVDKIPDKHKNNRGKWKSISKNYTLWDENKIQEEIIDKYCSKKFPQLPNIWENACWIQKVDIGKYLILYIFGGLYVDMDTEPNMENIQNLKGNIPLFYRNEEPIAGYITYNNNCMYVPNKENKIIKNIILECFRNFNRRPWDFYVYYISKSTGPIMISDVLSKFKYNYEYADIDRNIIRDFAHRSWLGKTGTIFDNTDKSDNILLFIIFTMTIVYIMLAISNEEETAQV